MSETDIIASVAAIIVWASGFASGYVLCYRRWRKDREQWFADARMLARYNNSVYRELAQRAGEPDRTPPIATARRMYYPEYLPDTRPAPDGGKY